MSIWFNEHRLDALNQHNQGTMVSHCGINITEIRPDALVGTMPVDERTIQPFGIVHGGANCVLAETLGSIAANLTCDPSTHHAVGISISTNHIKSVRSGTVKGIATPHHLGRSTHVWDIKTYNDDDQLTSVTQLTMAVVPK